MKRLLALPLVLLVACTADDSDRPDSGVDLATYIGWWTITYDRGDCGEGAVVIDIRITDAADGGIESDWGSDATIDASPGGAPLHVEYTDDVVGERLDMLLTPYDTSTTPAGPATARVKWEGDYLGEHCAMPDHVAASDVVIAPI